MLGKVWGFFRSQPARRDLPVVANRALGLAGSELSDEEATAELREVVESHPETAHILRDHWSGGGETRRHDRAYRLLEAAMDNSPVQPVDPERLKVFDRLGQLARISIGEAFGQLVALVPALADFAERELASTGVGLDADRRSREGAHAALGQLRQLDSILGPKADHPDALVRTWRAQQIVLTYLNVARGDTSCGTLASSYAEIDRCEMQRLAQSPDVEVWTDERTGATHSRISGRLF